MKILVVGLGSMGQRHLTNLKKIYPKCNFYALRIRKKKLIIKNTKVIKKKNLEKYYKVKMIKTYREAIKLRPNLVFICNQPASHLRDAIKFSKIKSHIFVEKPLLGSNKQIKKLKKIIKKNKINSMMGYQLRFHPIVKLIKKYISYNRFGRILKVDVACLSYLPKYHSYEDYSKSYASIKKLGGGVLSTLSHEIDLIAYFFGLPKKIYTNKINTGLLKTDVEDDVFSYLVYNSKNNFSVNLHLSFTHFFQQRYIKILFKKAFLKADLIENKIEIYSDKKEKLIFKKRYKFNRNKLFLEELRYFDYCLKQKKDNQLSIKNNIDTFKLFKALNKHKTIKI